MSPKDIKTLQAFILWLRKERIAYTTLSAGGITLDGVVDTKIERGAETKKEPTRETMFERYGADLLRQPAAKPSETVPEEAMIE